MTTRTQLRKDLADLKQKVYILGEKCVEITDLYNSLLESFSSNLENTLIQINQEVKKESKELNEQCFLVLTLQQPLIRDLRFVIGSLQIVLNLEKIAEQYLSTLPQVSQVNVLKLNLKSELIKMAHKVHHSLKSALTLYLSSNLNLHKEILKTFSEINYLHDVLYKHILNEVAEEHGEKAQIEAQLLSTIRSLEKISDLTHNLAEQVNYIIIGKYET